MFGINTSKCIYCLSEKPIKEFNIEHVVPRSFGCYENAYTLHKNQVCEECNSYFSKNFETSIGLDSLEALLRMTKSKKIMSDGRVLKDSRINVFGNSGIFKGLKFRVVTDQTTGERVKFIVYPAIGLKINDDSNEYTYFMPENLPCRTQEISDRLKGKKHPIIFWNIEKEYVDRILAERGYTYTECKLSSDITEVYTETEIETKIHVKIDSIIRRFTAKTAFNYLTYKFGHTYALNEKFDSIRKFIRYGIAEENIRFSYSHGRVMNFSDQKDAHIVGLVWGDESYKSIHGAVSWFNEATYTIWLCNNKRRLFHKLPISIFDNQNSKIIDTIENYVL